MKTQAVKIFLLFLIIIGFSLVCCAQKKPITFHSFDLGVGGYYFKTIYNEGGGATFTTNVTMSYDKNLFSTSYLTGAEIGLVFGSSYNFNEITLLYGREIKIKKWLALEGFTGIGYFVQESDIQSVMQGTSIAVPLKLNIKFYFIKNFGMGINCNYSFNSINDFFASNLIIHYKF